MGLAVAPDVSGRGKKKVKRISHMKVKAYYWLSAHTPQTISKPKRTVPP